jgi:hypothetical protein
MTDRQGQEPEETQTERVSGQPVDSKAELWKPGGGEVGEPERARDDETDAPTAANDEREAR